MQLFDREELESYLKKDIRALAHFYSIKMDRRMKKGDIIGLILEAQEPVEVEEELPPMSVRVKRIYDSQKE